MRLFNIGRQRKAEVWTSYGQRTLQVVLPKGTSTGTAQRAVAEHVNRWLERLEKRENLKLMTDVSIFGPHFCPFLEHFGEDMYLASARFNSLKPRMVKEDVLVGARRMAEDADVGYVEQRSARQDSLPEDMESQLKFVAENADDVYKDLRELEEMKNDASGK